VENIEEEAGYTQRRFGRFGKEKKSCPYRDSRPGLFDP